MLFISPYHMGARLQRGRGSYQKGSGIGGIFSALIRTLKPLLFRGASAGMKLAKQALAHSSVKKAISDIQSSVVQSGVNAVDRALNKRKAPALPSSSSSEKLPAKKKKKATKSDKKQKKKKKEKQGIF